MSRTRKPTQRWSILRTAAFMTFAEAADAASLETDR